MLGGFLQGYPPHGCPRSRWHTGTFSFGDARQAPREPEQVTAARLLALRTTHTLAPTALAPSAEELRTATGATLTENAVIKVHKRLSAIETR